VKKPLIPLLTYTPLKRRQPSITHSPVKRSRASAIYAPLKDSQSSAIQAFNCPLRTPAANQALTAPSSCDLHLPPLLIGPDHDELSDDVKFREVVKEKEAALRHISRLEEDLDNAKIEIARLRTFITEEGQRLLKGC